MFCSQDSGSCCTRCSELCLLDYQRRVHPVAWPSTWVWLKENGAGEHPDHVVVIKYVPYVADSKRAMDEYSAEIFMGGRQTIVMHNTCEDSLLAAPIILDLVILAGVMHPRDLASTTAIRPENIKVCDIGLASIYH